jgi:hypothetical protein
MLRLLLALSLTLVTAVSPAQDADLGCHLPGYQIEGMYYSEEWLPQRPKGKEACDQRQTQDAVSMEKKWKSNNNEIEALIDTMLKKQKCTEIHPFLNSYRESIRTHKSTFEKEQNARRDYIDALSTSLDLQRKFAVFQGVNSHCAGNQNLWGSVIDIHAVNRLLAPKGAKSTKVQNGEAAESCSDVRASGSDDLKSFSVNMANAIGQSFKFSYDVYAIPDRVILKSGNTVLLDTGCKSSSEMVQKEFPLSSLGGRKFIEVEIVNDCENPSDKGGSAWEIAVACEEKPIGEDECRLEKTKLAELLKKQIEIIKGFLSMNDTETGCMEHLDETVLPELLKKGLITLSDSPVINSLCDPLEGKKCKNYRQSQLKKELANISERTKNDFSTFASPEQQKNNLPTDNPNEKSSGCSEKPSYSKSIFEHISWAYCKHSPQRLEIK